MSSRHHQVGDVEHDPADEVRLFLVLLEVMASGSAKYLPVDVLDIVAGHMFAVLGEFDGEAVEGAFMLAREITFHDEASLQFQATHLRQGERIKRYFRGSSVAMWRF